MKDLSTSRILIVDDTEANVDLLVDTLGDEYNIAVAMDGETALEDAVENHPDLILLDIMMPGIDGYEVCRRLKDDPVTKHIVVIFLTAMTSQKDEVKGLAIGAVDYILKPFNPSLVKARVHNQLELKQHRDNLEGLVKERTKELKLTRDVTIVAMGTMAEYRDPETGGHIQRTQNYVRLLAEHLRSHLKFKDHIDNAMIEILFVSAPLHDIGKVGIADHILLKPGKLTIEEFEEMKQHSLVGSNIISRASKQLGNNSFLNVAREIAETHHEKWDGNGYPFGLHGERIPICGRLMAIADVYDALISKRVYKPAFSHQKAVNIITEGKGTHFDPDMVEAFLGIAHEFQRTASKYADRG